MAALIDISYFGDTLPLIVAENEAAIERAIINYEPDYLRAVFGPSLAEAFTIGLTPVANVVFFSEQFSDQFYKGGIENRWAWLRDGTTFESCGRKYVWPGLVNAQKRSPLANYTWWKYMKEVNPRATAMGGFADTALENATSVSPKATMVGVWAEMVEWHKILWKLLTLIDPTTKLPVYPELNRRELCDTESINVYNYQFDR